MGHVGSKCRAKPRCLYCGQDKHDESEEYSSREGPRKCINCSGEHSAVSRICPLIIQNEKIQTLAATCGISILEAKERVYWSSSDTIWNKKDKYDFKNFPIPNFKRRDGNTSIPVNNRFLSLPIVGEEDSYSSPFHMNYADAVKSFRHINRPQNYNKHIHSKIVKPKIISQSTVGSFRDTFDSNSHADKYSIISSQYSNADNVNNSTKERYNFATENIDKSNRFSYGADSCVPGGNYETFNSKYSISNHEHIGHFTGSVSNISHIKEMFDNLFIKDFIEYTYRYRDSSTLNNTLHKSDWDTCITTFKK